MLVLEDTKDLSFKTIVVDGDYLAFLAAASTETTTYFLYNKEKELLCTKPTIDSCKKFCVKNELNFEDLELVKEKPLHKNWEVIAKSVIINKIKKWKAACRCY